MANKLKRDNAYFVERLRKEHPQTHSEFLAGKFKNATEAFRVAGLIKTKTPLEQLEHAWNAASAAERDAFKMLIGCTGPAAPRGAPIVLGKASGAGTSLSHPAALPGPPTTHPAQGPAAAHIAPSSPAPGLSRPGRGKLSTTERAQVVEIMDRRGLTIGGVMKELGLNPLDASLGYALRRGEQGSLKTKVLDLLRPWMATHRKR